MRFNLYIDGIYSGRTQDFENEETAVAFVKEKAKAAPSKVIWYHKTDGDVYAMSYHRNFDIYTDGGVISEVV